MRSGFVTATSSPEGLVLHCHPEDAAQPTEPRTPVEPCELMLALLASVGQ
jgi:hypothetical protein